MCTAPHLERTTFVTLPVVTTPAWIRRAMIGRPRGTQLSWVSDISLSLMWQWLDREDPAFTLLSDPWIGDGPPESVTLLMCRHAEHLLFAPVAATGLELVNVMVWRNDAGPCTVGGSAATSNTCTKIRTARALPRVLRDVHQGADS